MTIRATDSPRRARLLRSTCVATVIGIGWAAAALPQDATTDGNTSAPAQPSAVLQAIVVTATRVQRKGYSAPTPTTVIGTQEINAAAPANVADYLNKIPSFAGSQTPTNSVEFVSAGLTGINALNLRNLNPNRTLVLLDGLRVAPSTLTDWVDANEIPQALIKRVDVVTGGASADWGSDAVAGVVNYVLDTDFTGLKADVQGGVTTYGDNGSYSVSLTGGHGFSDGRGHVLLSVQDAHSAGISGVPRDWYDGSKLIFNPNYTSTNGQPQLLVSPETGFATVTPGGIITSGPLKGTYFGPGGVPLQFNYGPLISGNFMQGGQWQYSDFAKSGDLAPRLTRQNIFLRASYDVTEHIRVYVQGSYTSTQSHEGALNQFNFGNLTIHSNNAFIPSSVAAEMNAMNLTSFTLGTFNQDLGPIIAVSNRTSHWGVAGARGDFDMLGSKWNWDVAGQLTRNDIYSAATLTETANFLSAINAVRNSNGAIVCQSTLTQPANGCVPYDIFGTGVNSQAALDYVLGTTWGRTRLTQDDFVADLHGNPLEDWAGPISVAMGVEHRREAVAGSNNPLDSQHAYFAGNYLASFGSYNVTEGYFETVVPLAKNYFLAKRLDFDGAVRATSYSTSGFVKTWKIGATYSPTSDMMFRVTRSRDIRAPDLAELFNSGQTSTTVVADPAAGGANDTIFQITSGNLGLEPEVADTLDLGVVLQPRFVEGLGASVDYYHIKINRTIATLTAQQVVNECYQGDAALCSDITRTSDVITSVAVQPINIAQQIARGIDFEVSYHRSLHDVAPVLSGVLTVRLLATHYLENYLNNGVTTPVDNVGDNSDNGTAGLSLPRWRYLATVGWSRRRLALTGTARGFGAGVYNTSYIQCSAGCPASSGSHMTINNNHLPGAIYFDTNISYDFTDSLQGYLTVDNVANKAPAQVAYGPSISGAPLSVNPSLYDVLGREFRLGFRLNIQ